MIIEMTNPSTGRKYKIKPNNELCYIIEKSSLNGESKSEWISTGKYPNDIPHAINLVLKLMLNEKENKDKLDIKPENAYKTIKGYFDSIKNEIMSNIIVKVTEDGQENTSNKG